MENLTNFEVVVGTYEEFLLGYKIENLKDIGLKQSFATHEHSSSLRTVTNSGKYLASGGADDRIHVYDMAIRKEHCMISHHNSTVNCLAFTQGNTHLISASTDGTLSITRVGNWVLEKTWEKSHKNGHILDLALHPSGKLFLSLGSDGTLQTWNLIKGRKAFTINLNSKSKDAKSLDFIKWGLNDEDFLLGGGLNLEIWNINTGGIKKQFSFSSKVICAEWIKEDLIIIGHENGKLTLLHLEKGNLKEIEAHSNRVKCLVFKNNILITASSSGEIKIWSYKSKNFTEIISTNTGCRITCLTLLTQQNTLKTEEKIPEVDTESADLAKARKMLEAKQKIIIEEENSDEDVINIPSKSTKTKNLSTKNKNSTNNKRKSQNEDIQDESLVEVKMKKKTKNKKRRKPQAQE